MVLVVLVLVLVVIVALYVVLLVVLYDMAQVLPRFNLLGRSHRSILVEIMVLSLQATIIPSQFQMAFSDLPPQHFYHATATYGGATRAVAHDIQHAGLELCKPWCATERSRPVVLSLSDSLGGSTEGSAPESYSKDPNNRPPLTNRPPYQILPHTNNYFHCLDSCLDLLQ